jgi:hypothetical protein
MALLELFKEQLENESRGLAESRSLAKRGDYLIWWYFLKLVGATPEDVEEGYCDGFNDYGIDFIRVDDADSTVHFYNFKNPVSIDDAFPSTEVDKLLMGLRLLIRNDLGAAGANEALRRRADEIRQLVPTGYRIHLVTSGTGMAPDVGTKLDGFIADLAMPDDFCMWELEDLQRLQTRFYTKTLPTVEDPLVFSLDYPPYQVRAAMHDSYMFAMSGEDLASVFGKHGEALLQQNIRVSQGDRATNALIKRTATASTESGNFLHYNNGVVFLAETANHDPFTKKLTLKRFQVVNGGQTIRVLWHALAAGQLRKDVLVPVRVITSGHDKDFANNVTVNLNNQNRIEPSFLRSNDPQVVTLASALASNGWYLERREAEVKTLTATDRALLEARLGGPLEGRTIGLTAGIQAYVATYMRQPELAKRYPKRIFLGIQDGGSFERVFSKDLTAEKVIAAYRLSAAVGNYVRDFGNLKRRKGRSRPEWEPEYAKLLGQPLAGKHGGVVDQVIPPSTVFLSAIAFDDWVNVQGRPVDDLIQTIETKSYLVLNMAVDDLIDVRNSIGGESRSWPTLLKSQTLYDAFALHRRRQK